MRYNAVTHDSVELLGVEPVVTEEHDTVLVMMYRTFLPLLDTIAATREALPWWPWLAAQTTRGPYRYAAMQAFWTNSVNDSLFTQGVAATWTVAFHTDSLGCWHISNDTTSIQRCDPNSPGRKRPH